MPAVIASGGHNELEQALLRRRLEYNLTPGVGGMLRNPKTVFMALFASLGGAVYGYNQGMFGQVLSMHSFQIASGVAGVTDPVKASMLTAILELGAWVGVLANGFMADSLGRKMCVQVAVFFFVLGAIVQACTTGGNPDFVYAGRFIVGLAIGSLSMIVPLYNAELAPPEIRGALVGLQQLAITFGIMISYWLTYGTNFIGGTGEGQSNAAWLVPICIQIVPVLALSIGFLFMPQSPRWLINEGRNEEALAIVAKLRNLPETHELVQLEYLEMLGQRVFEAKVSHMDHPDLQGQGTSIAIRRAFASYADLFTNRANLRRTINAIMIMVFQQWTGVNFILYYAPFIFAALNLAGNTTSLLASGVVGVVMFLATIPAVLYIDTVGRKPLLISGAILMGICHFSVSIIIARCSDDWPAHAAAGWVAAAFIWLFAIAFGFSWGPAAWVYVAECFPLGLRAKGISIGASSNWLNNFAVALSTYNFVVAAPYGAYIFLGMMCVFAALYVQFCTFETKGLTLDEIAQRFGDKSGRTQLENKLLKEAYGEVGLLRYVGVSSDHSPSDEKHDSFDKEKVEDTRVNTQAA